MKNEAHISELLAETFPRIDCHSEYIELLSRGTELQLTASSLLKSQSQKNKERLIQHSEAINAPGERTAATRKPLPEQQKAYQAMIEVTMHHNRALTDKGSLYYALR